MAIKNNIQYSIHTYITHNTIVESILVDLNIIDYCLFFKLFYKFDNIIRITIFFYLFLYFTSLHLYFINYHVFVCKWLLIKK